VEVPQHGGEGSEARDEGLGIVGEGFNEAVFVFLPEDAEDEGFRGGCDYSTTLLGGSFSSEEPGELHTDPREATPCQ
jgi:hypothetical protein